MGNPTTTVTRRHKKTATSDATAPRMAFLLLDTSWRVALPILVLSIGGHYLDEHTHHIMLFSLTGFFISLVIATLLVYRQLCIVFPDQFGKNSDKSNSKRDKREKEYR